MHFDWKKRFAHCESWPSAGKPPRGDRSRHRAKQRLQQYHELLAVRIAEQAATYHAGRDLTEKDREKIETPVRV